CSRHTNRYVPAVGNVSVYALGAPGPAFRTPELNRPVPSYVSPPEAGANGSSVAGSLPAAGKVTVWAPSADQWTVAPGWVWSTEGTNSNSSRYPVPPPGWSTATVAASAKTSQVVVPSEAVWVSTSARRSCRTLSICPSRLSRVAAPAASASSWVVGLASP